MFNLLEYGAKMWNTGNWLTFGKSMKTWNYKLEGWHDQFGTYILVSFSMSNNYVRRWRRKQNKLWKHINRYRTRTIENQDWLDRELGLTSNVETIFYSVKSYHISKNDGKQVFDQLNIDKCNIV